MLGLCALAARLGSGEIELTNRANLQIRGVGDAGHEPLLQGLAQLGMLDADPAIESRRNILVAPFWQPGDLTQRLARAQQSLAQAQETLATRQTQLDILIALFDPNLADTAIGVHSALAGLLEIVAVPSTAMEVLFSSVRLPDTSRSPPKLICTSSVLVFSTGPSIRT